MIPRHLSLVTQLPEREAALRAIIAVEEGGRAVRKPTPAAVSLFQSIFPVPDW